MGLWEDAKNIRDKDPAARNVAEVIILYPGFHVLVTHKIAHFLYRHRCFFLARLVSQLARHLTGIEIHPGAKIGRKLFIDHGMGIVFGETTEIGDNCTIYHGVTLGGTGKDTGKRHPTLGNNVLIGAGAKVLGPVYIGDNVRVGAGSVVLKNLPANATAVGVPAEIVRVGNIKCCPADDLDQQDLPDIVNQRISELHNMDQQQLWVCLNPLSQHFLFRYRISWRISWPIIVSFRRNCHEEIKRAYCF